MEEDLHKLKGILYCIIDVVDESLINPLEVGFVHSPLTEREKAERYKDKLDIIRQYCEFGLGGEVVNKTI